MSTEYGGISVDIVYFNEFNKWAFRFKQPDSMIPARTWFTQATIEMTNGEVCFSISNSYTNPLSAKEPVELTAPGFIKTLCEQIGVYDDIKLSTEPWHIASRNDLLELKSLLKHHF